MPLLDFKLLVAEVLTQKGSLLCTPTTRDRPPLAAIEEPQPKKSRKLLEMPSREVIQENGIHNFRSFVTLKAQLHTA